MAAEQDPYAVLGLQFGATDDEIKDAYRRLARKWHPDRNRNKPEASDVFERIARANETLTDVEKKAAVDAGHLAEAERLARRSKREKEMDSRRLSMKRKLEKAEAAGAAGQGAKRTVDEAALRAEGRRRREAAEERASAASAAAAAARKAAAASVAPRTLKVKWSSRQESHSDDTLVAVFRPFGEIEAVVMGDKGNSARVTFASPEPVAALVNHPELSVRFKLTAADRRAAAAPVAAAAAGWGGAPKAVRGYDFESVADAQLRRAQERARRIRAMSGGAGSAADDEEMPDAGVDSAGESDSAGEQGEEEDDSRVLKGDISLSPTGMSEYEEAVLRGLRELGGE